MIVYPCIDCPYYSFDKRRPTQCTLNVTREGIEEYQHVKRCPFRANMEEQQKAAEEWWRRA